MEFAEPASMQQGAGKVACLLLDFRVGRRMLSASLRTMRRRWFRFRLFLALVDKRKAHLIAPERARDAAVIFICSSLK